MRRLRVILASLFFLSAAAMLLVGLATQPFVSRTPSAPPAVDAAALRAHVTKLSVDFHPRSFDQARNLNLAANYIHDQFKRTRARVSVQEFETEDRKYKNIIAHFGPDSGPVLVIGAHYDTFGGTPGADDNASGVAGLIELARLLSRDGQKRPIELVAYTLEEPPYFGSEDMGSAHHARLLKEQGREVELMLSLEMIGYFTDAEGSQQYPLPGLSALYSDRGNFIALVGKLGDFGAMRKMKSLMLGATTLPVASFNSPTFVPGVDFSDHFSYWMQGYPAIMVTDTAFNRNDDYHGAGDTADKLDYDRMAKVVQGVYAVTQGF